MILLILSYNFEIIFRFINSQQMVSKNISQKKINSILKLIKFQSIEHFYTDDNLFSASQSYGFFLLISHAHTLTFHQ